MFSDKKRILQADDVHVVAFTAVADASINSLSRGQKLVFETPILNHGNGYHEQLGVFIAPETGIYIFSVTVMCQDGRWIESNLMQNGNVIARISATEQSGVDQGAVTVAISAVAADEVWVDVDWPESGAKYYGGRYTLFSGFLLTAL